VSTSRGLRFILVTTLALLAGCTNDTGRPKDPDGPGFFPEGPTPPQVLSPPTAPMTPVGTSGMGSMGTSPMGQPVGPVSCGVAKEIASGIVSDACVECACELNLAATVACTADCWQLMVCVARHCERTDTTCIVEHCNPSGDLSALTMAGNLARAVPIGSCAPECFFDGEISEAGSDHDF
jgi:hypothetical protein